jgi:hypothetical protein
VRISQIVRSPVGPGAIAFVILLVAYIALRSLSFWVMLAILLGGYGALPIAVAVSFTGVLCWQWRRNWISGLSVLFALLLVVLLGTIPRPISSPIGWAANLTRVGFYHGELEKSYMAAKARSDSVPVGQIYLDGFGSLTSGLAYDPSREIFKPVGARTEGWMDGPGQTELGLETLEVHHIVGPYYYWFHD